MAASNLSDWDADVKSVYGGLPRSRHSLWRFLKGMSEGDLVLVPGLAGWGTYSVYRIDGHPRRISDVELNGRVETWEGAEVTVTHGLLTADGEPDPLDLGFYRQVEVYNVRERDMKEISRYDYADRALADRMKIRMTNADISDLGKNLDDTLEAYSEGRPLRLYSHAIDETAPKLLESICKRLTSRKFEKLLKWYFERLGATAHIPPGSDRTKEGDADVIAVLDSLRLTIYLCTSEAPRQRQRHRRLGSAASQ